MKVWDMSYEEEILHEFLREGLSHFDAIKRLEDLGYAPEDAERMVDAWVEDVDRKKERT